MRVSVVIIFLLCAWLSTAIQYEILPYNPVADSNAVVTYGHARFTVLTPNLIRMEYSSTGKFEDRATVAVVNRFLPVPEFTQSNIGGVLEITTSSLILRYMIGKPFYEYTLNVTSVDPNSPFNTWHYGSDNPSNLLGTIKSLDNLNIISLNCNENSNVKVNGEVLHCEWGLISRAGWSVVNDTTNWGLDNRFWWDSPNTDDIDIYFFGHMNNYKEALSDYVKIGGRIAMVPRQVSGIWWSRWYNVNNVDVNSIVSDYKTRDLPLDVYILDMDWHKKYGWGGYTVDTSLFPYPVDTFNTLASEGLLVGANLHDADGVHPYDKMYKPFSQALGITSGNAIPFSSVNATYLFALDDIVLGDVENQGMNFWWIDWQQGGTTGGCQGDKQNPTYILSHLRGTDSVRHGGNLRGLVLARWGGLGTHRYQVGFSGDVAALTWSNLAFQPYFSLTASNVAYGFWSHDLVGPATDHELHTRWLQWGAYSAIFRTHDRGLSAGDCNDNPDGCPRIEVWNVPDNNFKANREAMIDRVSLIPYIYTAVRQAYDTGVSILRPMYYEYPKIDAAYAADANGNFGQYFFGDDIFVAPVTKPGLSNTTMAVTTIWIPPGTWVEKGTGVVHTSVNGFQLTKSWDLSEIPVFIRAGAIIPRIPVMVGDTIGVAQRQYNSLILTVYPESTSGTTNLYEDDGKTTDYISGKFSWTTISYSRTQTDFKLTVQPPTGSFNELPITRAYTIEIVNSLPVNSATVNGVKVVYSKYGGLNTWRYDGLRVTTIIETAWYPTSSPVTVVVQTDAVTDKFLSGFRGAFQKSILAKRNFDLTWSTPGSGSVESSYLADAASTATSLSYLAGTDSSTFTSTLNGFRQLFANAVQEIENLQPKPPPPPMSLVQLWDSDRMDNCLCADQDCLNSNSYYEQLRIEGYQPKSGSPDTIPLNDFWNSAINDNYATTQTVTPQGYTPAVFSDGIIYASQQPNTLPLQLYWSSERQDMLTVASAEGIQYANKYGYKLVNSTLGYVLTQPPVEEELKAYELTYSRWAYSMELLYNALN